MTEENKTQLDKATEPSPKAGADDKKREANPADPMKPEKAPAGTRPGPENVGRAPRRWQENEPEKTETYRLKDGYAHEGVEPGGEVELTPTQAAAFKDKFEKVGASKSGKTPQQLQEEQQGAPRPQATSHMPQDIGASTEVPDLNPGNKQPIPTK